MVNDVGCQSKTTKSKRINWLAAAPDFGKDLYNALNKKNKKEISTKGITKYTSNGLVIT